MQNPLFAQLIKESSQSCSAQLGAPNAWPNFTAVKLTTDLYFQQLSTYQLQLEINKVDLSNLFRSEVDQTAIHQLNDVKTNVLFGRWTWFKTLFIYIYLSH